MKKLAFVIDDITGTGGVERVTIFLANSLSSEYMVTIISLNGKNKELFYCLDKSVSLIFQHKVNALTKNIKLANLLKKINPCFIISMSMGRLSFRLSLIKIIFKIKSKLILSEHNAFRSSGKIIQTLKLFSYEFSDHVILLTQHDRRIITKKVKTKVTVIPNFSFYENYKTSDVNKQRVVLSVGRISYQKGFDRAIKIWSMLPPNQWKLLIVGKGSEADRVELQSLIDNAGLSNVIEVREPTAQLEELYASASIYMMTSRFEGLPLVLIECKSFGIPAIAFDCETGPSEIINNKVDGFLIPDGDEIDYCDKLYTLMHNDTLRDNFSSSALANAKIFSQENYLFKWKKIFTN